MVRALALCFLAAVGAAHANTTFVFEGSGLGAIADGTASGPGAARDVAFNVQNLTGPIVSVEVRTSLSHTFVGDLRAELIAPNGARLVLFSRVGSRNTSQFGDSSNLGGVYEFRDGANGDLWAAAAAAGGNDVIPAGVYRTSTPGRSPAGGCSSWLQATFGDTSAAAATGTWTLRLQDFAPGDTGSINQAQLSVVTGPSDRIHQGDFEASRLAPSTARGNCRKVVADMDGDGRSDFVMIRTVAGQKQWRVLPNPETGSGSLITFNLGEQFDFFVMGDFDGDGRADAAVWVPGTPGRYLIRPSSRPGQIWEIPFAQSGFDATVIGDFNGDNIDDFAAYSPATGEVRILRSFGFENRLSGLPQESFFAGGYDFDNNGSADFALQRAVPGQAPSALFTVYSPTGLALAQFAQGETSHVIWTGDFAGDDRWDMTTSRSVNSQLEFTLRVEGGAQTTLTFGQSIDFGAPADYDGDGTDDLAFWRPAAQAGDSRFFIRQSSSPESPPREVAMGLSGDGPVMVFRLK